MIKVYFFEFYTKKGALNNNYINNIYIYTYIHIYNPLIKIELALNVYDLIITVYRIIFRISAYEI